MRYSVKIANYRSFCSAKNNWNVIILEKILLFVTLKSRIEQCIYRCCISKSVLIGKKLYGKYQYLYWIAYNFTHIADCSTYKPNLSTNFHEDRMEKNAVCNIKPQIGRYKKDHSCQRYVEKFLKIYFQYASISFATA